MPTKYTIQAALTLVLTLTVALSTGCSTSSPDYFPSTGLTLPAKKYPADVEVRTQPPQRAYYRLGTLQLHGTHSWGKLVKKANKQAAEIGADFVCILDTSVEQHDVYIPGFSSASASGSAYGYGYGGWYQSSAHAQASAFSVGPSVRRVTVGNLTAFVGVYYPSRIGITWDPSAIPKFVIKEFEPDGTAKKSGLQVGDEVIAMDSIDMRNDNALVRHLLNVQPGQKLHVSVMRNNERSEFDLDTVPN